MTPKTRGPKPEILLLVALVAVAAAIRYAGKDHLTADYKVFLQPWSRYIATHGGFAALADDFANYNVPYLYLLALLTWVDEHTPVTLLPLIKGLSVVFDVVLAYYAARIVGLRHPGRIQLLAGLVVLLLPTVVFNGAYWAQCDTVYSAFTVAGVYYLLKDRPWVATTLFGLALAFKLQAVFVFPLLFVLLLAGRVRIRHLTVVPLVYVALAVPAWLAGRPFADLMLIYVKQSNQYGGLTMGAPSLYTFIRPSAADVDVVRTAGMLFAVAAVLVLAYAVLALRVTLDARRIVLLAAVFSILVPFLLPGMHERYFMQADVLVLVAAFWVPAQLWFVAVLEQIASGMSYLPYLFRGRATPPMDLRLLTVMMFTALVVLTAHLLRREPAAPAAQPVQPPAATPEPAAKEGVTV